MPCHRNGLDCPPPPSPRWRPSCWFTGLTYFRPPRYFLIKWIIRCVPLSVFCEGVLADFRSTFRPRLHRNSSWDVNGALPRCSFSTSSAHSRTGRTASCVMRSHAQGINLSKWPSPSTRLLVCSSRPLALSCLLLSDCCFCAAYRMTSGWN